MLVWIIFTSQRPHETLMFSQCGEGFVLKAQHVPQQVNRLGQTNNELDFGRVGWTQAEKGWILTGVCR